MILILAASVAWGIAGAVCGYVVGYRAGAHDMVTKIGALMPPRDGPRAA